MKYLPFELHTHTIHSDGKLTPAELAELLRSEGLAGFALTDHNTTSGLEDAAWAARSEGLVFIPGVEFTTFYGHITVLGKESIKRENWRDVNPYTVQFAAANCKSGGGAVGIAHPFRIGYPICTGGSDDFGMKRYEGITHYEVGSYPSPQKNPSNCAALERYCALWERGVRPSAVYGRDLHQPSEGAYGVTFLGCYDESTESALNAIRFGRTYLSTGVTLSASLEPIEGEGKPLSFGSRGRAGKYRFKAKADLWREDYTARFGVRIEGMELRGSALDAPVVLGSEGEVELDLKEGYLMLSAFGEIEGGKGILAIATPYEIGELRRYIDGGYETWNGDRELEEKTEADFWEMAGGRRK